MSFIEIVTPSPTGSLGGNRVTGERWARILGELGHVAMVVDSYKGTDVDALVAIHARRSADAVLEFRIKYPDRPLILGMSGTDLYVDIRNDKKAQQALGLAHRLVLLQPAGLDELPEDARDKARVIYQSVLPVPARSGVVPDGAFNVCVVGHLRDVKDPFCTAEAARSLPSDSRVNVVHVGKALSPEMEERAVAETGSNDRYQWRGQLERDETLELIASCDLLALTSRSEGGANVIGEAIVCGTPVVSSRISGSIGLLGADYPGYFDFGEREQLTALLRRLETDTAFHLQLTERCVGLAEQFSPARELASWRSLLAELEV